MKILITLCLATVFAGTAIAQDVSYHTGELKKARRISQDEWKTMLDQSGAQSSGYTARNSSDAADLTQKSVRMLKMNDAVQLSTEVTAAFENVVSGGQSADGALTGRARYQFKLGPGKFAVKDGMIKREP